MTLWICTGCTARYSVGAARCPHCKSTGHVEEGAHMGKITVHGGASHAADIAGPEAGEDVSAGSSSETSSEKQPSTPEPSETPRPSRARTAGNRSKPGRKAAESSTAEATATSGRETAASADD